MTLFHNHIKIGPRTSRTTATMAEKIGETTPFHTMEMIFPMVWNAG